MTTANANDALRPFYRHNGKTWPLLVTEYARMAGVSVQRASRTLAALADEGRLSRSIVYGDKGAKLAVYEVAQ